MRQMAQTALAVENLVKRYGATTAVAGLSLHIRRGEFFGLLGPNGAGKTTTLEMLCGLSAPDSGHIDLDGQPAWPRTAEQKRKLGIVPQDFAFYPTLSARDNLDYFGRLYGLGGKALQARIRLGLEMAQLEHRADDPAGHFSGGMKRRLNIAIGLLHEPEILILDEPTVGVDAQSRHAILETLSALNREGMTLIYSTHYLEEAQKLCHRVAIMDQGRLMALDTPQTLIRTLAGGLIRVTLSEPLDITQREILVRELGVVWCEDDAHRLLLETAEPETALPRLMNELSQRGLAVRGLEWQEPDLETVFLKLTGRQLRD